MSSAATQTLEQGEAAALCRVTTSPDDGALNPDAPLHVDGPRLGGCCRKYEHLCAPPKTKAQQPMMGGHQHRPITDNGVGRPPVNGCVPRLAAQKRRWGGQQGRSPKRSRLNAPCEAL